LIIEGLEISVFAVGESRTNVVQVVGDHADGQRELHWTPNRI